MEHVQVIYWREIPVQVKLKNGCSRIKKPLSERFQKTVYRAAYRAKAIHGSRYQEGWVLSDWQAREGVATEILIAVVAELENAYSDERLDNLALNKGYELK
jgi:hypothetical protein